MKFNFNIVKNGLTFSSNFIPSILLLGITDKIIIPSYTIISDTKPPHVKNILRIRSIKQFEKDIDFLLKNFEAIDLLKLIEIKKSNSPINKDYFHLTFDDGLREDYDIIAPILKRKGIPATFFINPSFIDNQGLMHRYKVSLIIEEIKNNKAKKDKVVKFIKRKMGIRREAPNFLLTLKYPHIRILNEIAQITETDFDDYLSKHKPYLTEEQISSMIKDGFTFGAHSLDHPEYSMLTEEDQLRQTIESIQIINKNFKLDYKVFSFPFTDRSISKNFFNKLYNNNNHFCDLSFGIAGLKNDIYLNHLQRISMEKKFSGESIIKGEYLYYYLNALFNKGQIKR